MRRKALLSMFVGLLLVGAYAAYAVSQPKLPEIREQPRKCNEILQVGLLWLRMQLE